MDACSLAMTNAGVGLIIGGVASVIAIIVLLIAMRATRRGRLISDLPTSKTTGVFIGLVEVKGTAESEAPLQTYLAETAAVWYKWSIDEHWSRTVTETYQDSDGKTKTRTRRESGWKTVAHGGEDSVFYLQDDEGTVRIIPDGAEIEGDTIYSETANRSDPLYYGKGPALAVADSDHRRRFVEHAIRLHSPIYTIGQSRLREDVVAPEIAYDKYAPMFMISTRSEEQLQSRYAWQFWAFGALAAVLWLAGWIIGDVQARAEPSRHVMKYIGLAFAYGMLFTGAWGWTVYNSLVGLKNRVNQAWSNVDVELKRRHDLIPRIVDVVEAMSHHERELQENVAALRAQAAATAPDAEGPNPEGVAARLIALKEAYPELKVHENFLQLQKSLIETEQRLALAREYYNESVQYYNTRREIVPDRFIAALIGMSPRKPIEAAAFERAAVQVRFAE